MPELTQASGSGRLRHARGGRGSLGRGSANPQGPEFLAADFRRGDLVTRTVEREILPRLLLARRVEPVLARLPAVAVVPTADAIVEFADLVLLEDQRGATAFVADWRRRGLAVDALYLDLLAPAARQLGRLWDEDRRDFGEVTLGLLRMHEMLRDLGPAFRNEARLRAHGQSALLVSMPGEQHTLGIVMVADFFRRAGWDVVCEPVASSEDLAHLARAGGFALVGISLAHGERLEDLSKCIRRVRRSTRGRSLGVMVGGPIFSEHPELAALVGADATAGDARQAPLQAEQLLSLLAGQG